MINKNSKIFLTGRNGLAGSAIERKLNEKGYHNIIGLRSAELDLRRQADVEAYFEKEKPDYVILAAAKVGGIAANSKAPVEFLYENLQIQNNVIYSAFQNGVKDLLFLGSSCIYPRLAPQPMKEEILLQGALEPTNEGYALAKIAGIKLCEYLNREYQTNYISVMPCNLYGVKDNFNLEGSHFIPALIRRFHTAKIQNDPTVAVWGTGKARREIMCSDDLADACLFLMESGYSENQFINVGTGIDYSVREIAENIKEVVGYQGDIVFDTSKPDGMPQKLMDLSRLNDMGWKPQISLEEGLKRTYEYYLTFGR